MVSTVFRYILFLLAAFEVHGGDGDTNQTTIYMLGCLKNRHSLNHTTFDVLVLNSNLDNVHVSISSHDGQASNFTVQSRGVYTEHFPSDVEVVGSTLSRKGIKVTSDRQLFVYGISQNVIGFEGFLSLPTHYQGNHYFIITGVSESEFLIVGIYSNTDVCVFLRLSEENIWYQNKTYANGSTIAETLNEYDTMQVHNKGDFTGTEIRSSKPVSVFSGNKFIGNPPRNYLVEQLPSLDNWGKEYVTVASQGFTYDCKIISGSPDTLVNYTCSTNVVENLYLKEAGSFKTLTFGNSTCFLISNKPILVNIIVDSNDTSQCLITMSALENIEGEPMVYVAADMANTQLVIVTNVNITVIPANETITEYNECPSHLNTINICIIRVRLNGSQTYTISSMTQPFVISAYIHGQMHKGRRRYRGIGFPILYHTPKAEQTTSERVNVTCGESTQFPDSSTEGPSPTLAQNRSCQCCSSRNHTKNYTKEDLADIIALLRDKLHVKRKKTNLYIRSLISAPDQRVSSKVIGYATGCVLGFLGICLILLDMRNLIEMFKNIRVNVFSR